MNLKHAYTSFQKRYLNNDKNSNTELGANLLEDVLA